MVLEIHILLQNNSRFSFSDYSAEYNDFTTDYQSLYVTHALVYLADSYVECLSRKLFPHLS